MPSAEFLRILLHPGSKFWKGGSNREKGGVNKVGGVICRAGGLVTFQNTRSVQTHLRENFKLYFL